MKTGQPFIPISCTITGLSGSPDDEELRTLMHGEGMHPGMQEPEILMMEMWDTLTDDQKKTLMKRKLDDKIMMKEGMIKHFQFKIETFKLIKKMLDEC
jgi:hypothetical protein